MLIDPVFHQSTSFGMGLSRGASLPWPRGRPWAAGEHCLALVSYEANGHPWPQRVSGSALYLIENAFCRIKDFQRVTMRYDKLSANFFSAVAIATRVDMRSDFPHQAV